LIVAPAMISAEKERSISVASLGKSGPERKIEGKGSKLEL
jgi:hypothetical protein